MRKNHFIFAVLLIAAVIFAYPAGSYADSHGKSCKGGDDKSCSHHSKMSDHHGSKGKHVKGHGNKGDWGHKSGKSCSGDCSGSFGHKGHKETMKRSKYDLPCTPSQERARNVEFTYEFKVRDIPRNAKNAHAWIPVPRNRADQMLVDHSVHGDWNYELVSDDEYGNKFLRFDLSNYNHSEADIKVTYNVKRMAFSPISCTSGCNYKEDVSHKHLNRYLRDDRMVPSNGPIAKEAKMVVGDERDRVKKARRLYDNVVKTVDYDKSGEGWGRGDALYACNVRAGNCTDFHSLFIGQARSQEIPARFVIGFSIPSESNQGQISGYHCWAEFYDDEYGWLPVDASEAHKNPDWHEAYFGGLEENRIEFTHGRDIRLPGSNSEPLNYIIYPHVEVDGEVHENVDTMFRYRDI